MILLSLFAIFICSNKMDHLTVSAAVKFIRTFYAFLFIRCLTMKTVGQPAKKGKENLVECAGEGTLCLMTEAVKF